MTTTSTVTADYASPATRGPSRPLHRMPLVWLVVGVPAAFVLFLTFLTPSL